MIVCWFWLMCGIVAFVKSLAGAGAEQDLCPEPPVPWFDESLPQMSSCSIRCAMESYLRMLSSPEGISVLFTEALPGYQEDSCWLLRLRCRKGDKLTRAFVVLDMEAKEQPVRLLITTPSTKLKLVRPLPGDTGILSPACGLRFEVTKPFQAAENAGAFCVRPTCESQPQCQLSFKCPPFLVTVWDTPRQPAG